MDAFSPHSMLYQTHHPLLFQFHLFAHSISDLPASSSSLTSVFSHLPVLQAETQMECVEAALKTGSRKDTGMKLNPQCFVEDWSALNVQNVAPSDDFFVDELLDFSHMEEPPEEEQQQQHKVESGSISPTPQDQSHETCNFTSTYSAKHDVESGPSSELSVPADDLADLEWLSHFVEDSFSEYSTAYPAGILTENPKSHHAEEGPEPQSPVSTQPCFKTPVPAKARSKRTRTGGRVWSLGSPSFTESSSSSTSSSSSSSPTSPWLIYANPALDQVSSGAKPPVKKPKKKPAPDSTGTGAAAAQAPRRCTHCGVHKTPQWRTGPLGAKTLCNACGVRYKSGRLLPEYRPACSPTFSSELHSNHHRKVLEMRRKKEVPAGVDSGLGFAPTPAVPTF